VAEEVGEQLVVEGQYCGLVFGVAVAEARLQLKAVVMASL
jgi:hypothetical protein